MPDGVPDAHTVKSQNTRGYVTKITVQAIPINKRSMNQNAAM